MKSLLYCLAVLALCLIMYGESRKFYCFEKDRCITVWKTFGNTCYIIRGNYYGLWLPNSFIETSNVNNLTLYFTDRLPSSLVYKSEQPVLIRKFGDEENFYDFNSDSKKFDDMLYEVTASKNNEVKDGVTMVDLFIRENFAIDKNGKRF